MIFLSNFILLPVVLSRTVCFERDVLQTLSSCKDLQRPRRGYRTVCKEELSSDRIKVSHV